MTTQTDCQPKPEGDWEKAFDEKFPPFKFGTWPDVSVGTLADVKDIKEFISSILSSQKADIIRAVAGAVPEEVFKNKLHESNTYDFCLGWNQAREAVLKKLSEI
jgi:hypothetical protein